MTTDGPERRIPVARPSLGEREEELVLEVLRSGWVTQGPRVLELERRFAGCVEAAEAVAVSSGTTALSLALYAHDIGSGHEVIVPSLSFIATANAICHVGATPVFCDVAERGYNLDPAEAEKLVTPRTRAILLVHQLGHPADLAVWHALAERHGLLLVEDAACAVGSRLRDRPIGSSGLACFSLHARKVVVAGEGGVITTDDSALAERLRRLRHQGMSSSDLERHRANRIVVEDYPEIGFNYRMSDLEAAVALGQLERLGEFLVRRREIAARYDEALADLPGIEVPQRPSADVTPNYQSYIVRLSGRARADRDRLMNELHLRGVATRRGLMAAHLEPAYADTALRRPLPHTEAAEAQTLILPMFTDLTSEDQRYVIAELSSAWRRELERS